MIKAHTGISHEHDTRRTSTSLKPSDGVVYKPDADADFKIEGEPYQKEQRERQKKIMAQAGKRQKAFQKTVSLVDTFESSKVNDKIKDFLNSKLDSSKLSFFY